MSNFFNILAFPLGYVMEWIYRLVNNYALALILFTLVIKVVTFPLSMKQQKSMVRQAAYQPMIQEIQKKWANDKTRQNEEMMKFQQEAGFSMTAGCLPMAVSMFIIFGLIQVVYRPLQFILHISTDVIDQAAKLAGIATNNAYVQNTLINLVQADPAKYSSVFGDKLSEIQNFNIHFLNLDLSQMPTFAFSSAALYSLVLPVLAVVTMIATQIISTKMSGQELQGSMKYMPWMMSIMFGFFCFRVPMGFSLYYTVSNVLQLIQSIILKQMYDPEKMKEQVKAELEEKRAAKKRKKTVAVETEDGKVQEREVTDAELARIRLAKARAIDEERYKE